LFHNHVSWIDQEKNVKGFHLLAAEKMLEFHAGQMQAKQAKTNLTQKVWSYRIDKRFYNSKDIS